MAEHQGVVLLDLPNEMILNIANRLELEDVRRLRKVSKHLSWIATLLLFQDVVLTPCRRSAGRLQHLLQSPILDKLIKHAILDCASEAFTTELITDFPDDFDSTDADYEIDEEADPTREIEECLETAIIQRSIRFGETMQKLGLAPNLKHITVQFSRYCADPGYTAWRWYEDLEVKRLFMTRLFDMLGSAHIQSLTINDLHGLAEEELSDHHAFTLALSRLEELHMKITHPEYLETRGYDESEKQLSSFDTWLFNKWIGPLSANLSHMTLFKYQNWGSLPSLFNASLSFPRLKYLSLGRYTIAHDDQIDWILRTDTLKILRLHECMICFSILVSDTGKRKWGLPTEGWRELPLHPELVPIYNHYLGSSERAHHYDYSGTWADHFNRLRDGLQLTDFVFTFDAVDWDPTPCRFDIRQTKLPLSPVRYAVFDGIKHQWPWHTFYGGSYHWRHGQNPHESRRAADEAALKELTEAAAARHTRSSI